MSWLLAIKYGLFVLYWIMLFKLELELEKCEVFNWIGWVESLL
jgi:hypothetical protein